MTQNQTLKQETALPLDARAMLIGLKIASWSGRKNDPVLNMEIANAHQSDPDQHRVTRKLLPRHALKEVSAAATAARRIHYANTLPWTDDGMRILPTKNYLRYMDEMREPRIRFEAAVADFLAKFPDYRAEAEQRLGDLFDASEYPAPRELELAFSFDTSVYPLPSGRDFRANIDEDDRATMQRQIEARTRSAIDDALKDVWRRAQETIERVKTRIDAYQVDIETKKKTGRIHKALFEALEGLAGTMRALNINDDPNMDRMSREIEKSLAAYDVEEVRDSETTRRELSSRADEILAKIKGFAGEPEPAE